MYLVVSDCTVAGLNEPAFGRGYTVNLMRSPILVTAFLIVLMACFGVSGHESEEKDQKPYVDLDGDGFDDNAADSDSDGIPDRFERDYVAPRGFAAVPSTDIFAALKQSSPVSPVATSSLERFVLRQFACRAQSKCRSNFESEFTTGLGITAGSSGGRCVGGVCF